MAKARATKADDMFMARIGDVKGCTPGTIEVASSAYDDVEEEGEYDYFLGTITVKAGGAVEVDAGCDPVLVCHIKSLPRLIAALQKLVDAQK